MQVFIPQRKHDSWLFEAWLIARVTAGLTAVTDKAQGTAKLVSVIEIWEEGGGDTDQRFHSVYHSSPCQLCVYTTGASLGVIYFSSCSVPPKRTLNGSFGLYLL